MGHHAIFKAIIELISKRKISNFDRAVSPQHGGAGLIAGPADVKVAWGGGGVGWKTRPNQGGDISQHLTTHTSLPCLSVRAFFQRAT